MPAVPGTPVMSPEARAPGLLIEIEDLAVKFGTATALSHVGLKLSGGEIVSLIGPNGAGKTTLVRVAAGLIAPTAGTLWRRPGLRLGYVPQRLKIDRVLPLSVRRFLALAGKASRAEAETALGEVEAAGLMEHSIHDLSGGEFQRVMLARAMLRKPDLLLLDEPLQGVDLGGQVSLYDLIGRLRDRHGLGVLLVSHDLHIVMAATDRVVCLNHHVCCSGAPEAIRHHPEYVALFGPEAARRLAVYAHDHDHDHDLAGNPVPPEPRP